LVSLYEPQACLVQQDGTLACGPEAIRENARPKHPIMRAAAHGHAVTVSSGR
jgi:hypothetical protein